MKKILFLVSFLCIWSALTAESIVVSGSCINAPITLTDTTTDHGKPAYTGTGRVAGIENVQISISWLMPDSLWVLSFDGQPYFSSACNSPAPPGTAHSSCSWTSVFGTECSITTPLSVTGNVALWVTFGAVSAYIQNNSLHVKWTTEKEVNNDHFNIEASKDGVNFTAIATVSSKATNGNSDSKIEYEWRADKNSLLAMMPYLAVLLILLMLLGRKRAVSLGFMGIAFIVLANLSCAKSKEAIKEDAAIQHYIRIAQVDTDGKTTHSKVIQVVNE